jgi:pilus assembly protein CpaF
VVHLGIDAAGVRRVNEIVAVPGRVENDTIETDSIFVRESDRLVRTHGMPPHLERYQRAGVDVHMMLNGAP